MKRCLIVCIPSLVEIGEERIVVLNRDRVVLVGMTLRAAHRQSHPDLQSRVNTILDCCDAELFVVRSSLVVGHRIPMECCCQNLIVGAIWQQVAT